MSKIDNYSFYYNAYKKHGVSAKGLKWTSKERQFLRFKILCDFIKNEIEDSTLLDIGCGYGDLINYFNESMKYPKIYTGLDCEEFILKIAKKRFPNSTFIKKNILSNELPTHDYFILSGSLNILEKDEFLNGIINCYKYCKKGFIFNFLTKSYVHDLSAFEILTFCKSLCKNVEFKNDYLDNDFTIFMKK